MAAPFDWFAGADALDYSVVKQTTITFDVNVRDASSTCRCKSGPAWGSQAANGLPFIVQRNGFAIVALK